MDCVVCTDVLEHVNNLHEVFEELIRITKRYVIISVPNGFNYEVVLEYGLELISSFMDYLRINLMIGINGL